MKLKYKTISSERKKILQVEHINVRHYEQNWHFHEEFELIYYIKGNGTRVVGDYLSDFNAKDLVLVGSGLPHLWKNNDDLDHEGLDAIVIKFDINQSAFSLLSATEFSEVKNMLIMSQRGISFSEDVAEKLNGLLTAMLSCDEAMQFILLLQVLNVLAKTNEKTLLASAEFALPKSNSEEQRLNKIIEYVTNNYTKAITLEDISKEAAMTSNSLCRFFKMRTNRTIFQYLNEYRVGKACEMLIGGTHSISEVCFEAGFNSLTSFNRVFKELKNDTPRNFKRKYQTLNSGANIHAYSA